MQPPSDFALSIGLKLFPVNAGGGHALGPNTWLKESTDDRETILEACRSRQFVHDMLAVQCELSNVVVLDIDDPANWDDYWPGTLASWSKRKGGRHLYFRQPADRVRCGNPARSVAWKASKGRHSADIKGDGGYARLYDKWLDETAPILPFPAELRPVKTPIQQQVDSGWRRVSGWERDVLNKSLTSQDIEQELLRRGWKACGASTSSFDTANRHYTRPGKSSGTSATLTTDREGLATLHVFSSSEEATGLPHDRNLRPCHLVELWRDD